MVEAINFLTTKEPTSIVFWYVGFPRTLEGSYDVLGGRGEDHPVILCSIMYAVARRF
jgi:hypothetical protein